MLLQRGHAAGVSTIAFSADGSRMITGGSDSTVRIWRVADRMLLRVLPYHMVGVTGLALSPDGRLLASGDGAGWLRTWDMVKGLELPAEPPHDRAVDRVAFLPDGAHYVSLDLDGKSWLWSTADAGPRILPLSAHSQALAIAPSPGPFAFALAEADGKIMLHGPDGALRKTMDGPGGTVSSRRMATDGRLLAAGDDRGRAVVWDVGTGKELLRRQFEGAIDVLSLSASKVLAVAAGRTIHLVPLESQDEGTTRHLGVPQAVNQSAFSNDGQWLAVCTQGGSIHLWRVGDPGAARPVALENAETSGRATTLSFSPDSRKVVAGDQDGGIRTWDLPHGVQRPPIPPRRGQVAALSVSRDGRYLLQISQDRQAQVWDLQEGRGLTTIEGSWTSGALTPDGEAIVLTSEADGDLVVVDADGRRRRTTFRLPGAAGGDGSLAGHFGKVAVSPDGRLVAAAGVQGTLVCVWDAVTGKLVHTIRGHEEPHPITAVQFSPDSPQLLTASEDGSAKLWDLEGGKEAPREAAAFRMIDEALGVTVAITAARVGPKDRPGRHRRDRWPDFLVGGRAGQADRPGSLGQKSWP
ncbi:MAG: WD40 repeat domain-containing protein [Singulisphaera sp.]